MILDEVSLDIHRNQITALIGKSGVGKSVLIKHIIGLIEPDSGNIIFDGQSYATMSRKDFAAIKSRCSYMFQNNALFDSLTVYENIALPLQERSGFSHVDIAKKVNQRIAQLELNEVQHLYPKQISGGMQKRVALARALITDPEIIFFDEPTTGLDPIRKNTVFTMIHRYHQELNFTALIITHDVPDIFYIAHQVHILDLGKIVFSGSPAELERSTNTDLHQYIHGHDILVNELTGLHSRTEFMHAYAAAQHDAAGLVSIQIKGLRAATDYEGQLKVFALRKALGYFLRQFSEPVPFPAVFSQEIFLLLLPGATAVQTEQIQAALKSFFDHPQMTALRERNKISIELGCARVPPHTSVCAALKTTLASCEILS
ncbi:hypothetical protein MASR1M90_20640 [Desulfovibrionales bacterium]